MAIYSGYTHCGCRAALLSNLEDSANQYWIHGEWRYVTRCKACRMFLYRGYWYGSWRSLGLPQLSLDCKDVQFPDGIKKTLEEFMTDLYSYQQTSQSTIHFQGDKVLHDIRFTVSVKTLREAAAAKAEILREEEKAAAAELDAFRKKQDEDVQAQCGQYRRSRGRPENAASYNNEEDKLINKAEVLCNKAAALEHWVDLLGVEVDTTEKEVDRTDLEYLGVVDEFPRQ